MRVLLDCDGVLADFIGRVISTIERLGGSVFTPDQVTEFDFCKSLELDPFLARAVKKAISNEPGWWSSIAPFPEAIEGVARLREVAEVFVVTSPWNSCQTWHYEREAWLKKHFAIPAKNLIVCSAKHLIAGGVFVDDKTSALHDWQGENEGTAIQWRTPHNRRDGWLGPSTCSWSELIGWVRSP